MKYNFDEIINRQGTNAMSTDGFREYLFEDSDELDLPCEKEDLISMWIADMEFGTAPEIIKGIQERLSQRILGYSQIFDPKYAEAFLNWTKSRYDWTFEEEHLVTSPGVVPALFDLIPYICQPDEQLLIMTPSYAFFKHCADYNKIEMVTSDLICEDGYYSIDFEDFRKKAAEEKVTLTILCSPHNPTGRVWTATELKKIGEICLENSVTIIADEIHCDLLRKEKTFVPIAKLFPDTDQIITCMSPSKTFNLAGLQFANIIIPNNELREMWNHHHLPLDNPLSIAAAQAAYADGQDWLDELSDYLDDNFIFLEKFLLEYLPKAKFNISEATYLAWINVGSYFPKEENLTLFFANKAGVLLEGGNMFVANSDGYIRLNLACPRARLEEGLEKISKAILSRKI
ncbi:MAG: MalY/PatB family protein [Saprospiraceae bacterium]